MKSKFQYLIEQQDSLKNDGFNYRDQIYKRFVSSYIYYNEKIQDGLKELEKFTQLTVYNIKNIKKFFNYTIRKEQDNFN